MKTTEKVSRLAKLWVKILILDAVRSRKSFEKVLKEAQEKEQIDICNPRTFDDKIWYMKKHFYSELVVQCADKVRVRDYVKECGLEEILIPICGVYNSLHEVDFSKLPDECYIKCNHTSGANFLYQRGITDVKWLTKLFDLYLKRNYYHVSKEWAYKDIPRKIIIEHKLEGKKDKELKDYRLFCFDGKLKVVLVNVGTATEQGEHAKSVSRSFYNSEFEPIPELFILGDSQPGKLVDRPDEWNKMVEIAQRISKPFAFCRVDLYNVDGKIFLGEMTFTPNAGVNKIHPQEWALQMGEWLDLEKCRNNPIYEYVE